MNTKSGNIPLSSFKILISIYILTLPGFLTAENDSIHQITQTNPVRSSTNDTIIYFEENFDDGDHTNNPVWHPDIRQSCALDPPQILVENGVLKIYEANAGSCGTNASIIIDLDIPISDSTKIKFDVKPVYSSVDEGAGWLDVEYPVYFVLWFSDINNKFLRLRFGYNYRGGESFYSKDNISIAFPYCKQDVWLRNEVFTIRDYFPDAVSVKRLWIGGSGWDYEGYADNIIIFNNNPNFHPDSILNYKEEQVHTLEHIGLDYSSISKHEKAIEMYKKNLRINEKMGNKLGVNRFLYLIGDLYLKTGNYDSALTYFRRSCEICNEIDKKFAKIVSLKGIAEIHLLWNEYDKALETYENILALNEETGNKNEIIFSLNEIASIYNLSGNSQKAIEYYQRSLELCQETGKTKDVAKTLENLGNIFNKDGNYEMAMEYFRESLKISEKDGDLNSAALSLFNIANIYSGLKNYNLAIDNLKKSLQIAQNQNLKSLISKIYLCFSEIYDKTGDNKTAFGYYKLYEETKDLISDKERNKEISDLHIKYQIEIKEKEIELLNREKEIQLLEINKYKTQKYIYIGIAVFAFVLILIIFLLFNRFKLKKEKQQSDLEKQKQEIEKKLLRSQMNPHFIFNSLNSINSFITGKDTYTAQSYLSMFAELMRYILENTRKSFIPLEDEIKTLRLNMELERLRFNNKFDFKINVLPDIDTENTYIPPMLIQPFVENAIIHGIMNKSGNGNIIIDLNKDHDLIFCTVKDDGVGRKKAKEIMNQSKQKHKSIGLQLTNERLYLLSRQRKSQFEVKITDLKDENGIATGTRVDLSIPFESE